MSNKTSKPSWIKISSIEYKRDDEALLEFFAETSSHAAAWWLSTDEKTEGPYMSAEAAGVPAAVVAGPAFEDNSEIAAAGSGHNNPPSPVLPEEEKEKPVTASVAADRLRSIVDRWERLDEEKKALSSDQKDIMSEAKSSGFDTAVLREIFRLRKMEPATVEERETLVNVYRRALGM